VLNFSKKRLFLTSRIFIFIFIFIKKLLITKHKNMKRVLLFTLSLLLMSTVTFAQKGKKAGKAKEVKEVKHPGEMGNATVDGYVTEAFGHVTTKTALAADLTKLEEDAKAAELASTSEDAAAAMMKRADALEAGYTKLGTDIEATSEKAEAASKASADCGMKAMKCAKAVKTATSAMAGISNGLPAEVKRSAEVKAKVEAVGRVN
jgi:hypothetical protein